MKKCKIPSTLEHDDRKSFPILNSVPVNIKIQKFYKLKNSWFHYIFKLLCFSTPVKPFQKVLSNIEKKASFDSFSSCFQSLLTKEAKKKVEEETNRIAELRRKVLVERCGKAKDLNGLSDGITIVEHCQMYSISYLS